MRRTTAQIFWGKQIGRPKQLYNLPKEMSLDWSAFCAPCQFIGQANPGFVCIFDLSPMTGLPARSVYFWTWPVEVKATLGLSRNASYTKTSPYRPDSPPTLCSCPLYMFRLNGPLLCCSWLRYVPIRLVLISLGIGAPLILRNKAKPFNAFGIAQYIKTLA